MAEKTQIKYIQVGDSKTTSGITKVPLHQELLNMKFPLLIGRELLEKGFIVDVSKQNLSFSKID